MFSDDRYPRLTREIGRVVAYVVSVLLLFFFLFSFFLPFEYSLILALGLAKTSNEWFLSLFSVQSHWQLDHWLSSGTALLKALTEHT